MIPRPHNSLQWNFAFAGPHHLPAKLGYLELPLFQAAVTEFHTATRLPLDLGYFTALGALSVALQSQVDMVTPQGRRPASLYMLGIGQSSGGKSSLAEYFFQAVETFEASRTDLFRGRTLIFDKGSTAGLYKAMRELSTTVLLSYEGKKLLESLVKSDASELNNAWSGEPIRRNTIKHGNLLLRNARLSMFAVIHPVLLDDVMRLHGRALRTSGFLGRLLVVATPSGPSIDLVHGVQGPLPAKAAFEARLIQLLEAGIKAADTADFERFAPPLSAEAEELRIAYAQSRIQMTYEQGYFESEPEHALKLAENAIRIAVLLHVFEGFQGPISASTIWAAIVLVEMFSQHYLANLGSQGSMFSKLTLLNDWIDRRFRHGVPVARDRFPKSLIGQIGPNSLRDPKVYEPLLDVLEAEGLIRRVRSGGGVQILLSPFQPVNSKL